MPRTRPHTTASCTCGTFRPRRRPSSRRLSASCSGVVASAPSASSGCSTTQRTARPTSPEWWPGAGSRDGLRGRLGLRGILRLGLHGSVEAGVPWHPPPQGLHVPRGGRSSRRDVVYTLGAFWINSGLITTPLLPGHQDGGATYCSTLGGSPTPAPASTAPGAAITETCFECGHVRMTTPTGSALVGDGGGLGFSSNRQVRVLRGRARQRRAGHHRCHGPANPFKVASLPPALPPAPAR